MVKSTDARPIEGHPAGAAGPEAGTAPVADTMSLERRKKYLADCSRCSNCKWVPVVKSERFAHICPSTLYGGFHSYSASGMLINGYSLLEGTVDYTESLLDSLFACSMCGGCDINCKTNFGDLIEPMDSLYALRERVVRDGRLPAPLAEAALHLRNSGNALGSPRDRRGAWCRGMELTVTGDKPSADVLLHVGDAAFDEAQWPQLRFVADALRRAGVVFAIGGADEPDSGALAFDIGHRELALTLARATAEWVKASGAARLITCSDSAFAAFRAVYPRLGVTLDGVHVQHVSEWLAGSASGADGGGGTDIVTYHDSCRLGRLSEPYRPWHGHWSLALNSLPVRTNATPTRFGTGGVYDAPRRLLANTGAQIVEMERSREAAFCCGAGGGAAEAHPAFARSAARHRLDEAMATGAGTLVTSCGTCRSHLAAHAEADGLPLRVLTILEYLLQCGAAPPHADGGSV